MQPRSLFAIAVLLIAGLTPVAPVSAAPRCFAETKQCLDGRVRQYWEQNGGLPVFGFPIAAQAREQNRDTGQSYETQWMERNRFELHPENQAPYDVLLGRLGDDRLRQLGIDWHALPKTDPSAQHYFAATGQAITHEPFWRYWSTHGLDLGDPGVSERESLALFGLPISPLQIETNTSGDTVQTQWFERARFEDHGPKGVLLGLLGNEVRANTNPGTVPPPPPPPTNAPLPPSFNNCQADPRANEAPNQPIRLTVNKVTEIARLTNVSPTAIDLTGWRICSIRGNQLHATLNGTLGVGESLNVTSQAGGNIWSNSEPDDGALYDANGSLVSYWRDTTE